MTEYIKREEAIRAILNDYPEQVGYSREDAADCIRYMPAADVAPVRHGRWVETRITRYNGDKPYTQFAHSCSQCKYLNKKKKGWHTNYCPNCGAKMDLEVTNDA